MPILRFVERARQVTAGLLLLLAAVYGAGWVNRWPLAGCLSEFENRGHFPLDGPRDRVHYLHDLVVGPTETVEGATCVLCSITVVGSARSVKAFWGDVTVHGTAGLVRAEGGRVVAHGAAQIGAGVEATGGIVEVAGNVVHDRLRVNTTPVLYFPGQRSYPWLGVTVFIALAFLGAACGDWCLTESARARVRLAAERPARAAAVTLAAIPVAVCLGLAAAVLLWTIYPLAIALLATITLVPWYAGAIGMSALAARVGRRLGATEVWAVGQGAAALVAVWLVPVVGAFIHLACCVVALGVGLCAFRWRATSNGSAPEDAESH